MGAPTARQIEYAMALGITLPEDVTKETISKLIDKTLKAGSTSPDKNQIRFARAHGISTEGIETFDEMVSVLYEHIKVRRWVFSVLRHHVKAPWVKHSQSGLPDRYADEIAHALKQDKKLMEKVEAKQGGNVSAGGDVWYRMTDKAVNSAEYQFVRDFDLPDDVIRKINLSHATRAGDQFVRGVKRSDDVRKKTNQSRAKSGGCLSIVLTIAACIAAILVW